MAEITKIIVIEPKALITKQLKRNLTSKPNIIFTVKTIHEAVQRLKFIYFDILIVDIQTEHNLSEDFHLLRSIRWMSPQIKIILLMSENKVQQIEDPDELEISNLIAKPWKNKELIESVNQVISISSLCLV